MYEEHLEHLLSRKLEIDEVSPWARVKLRLIKDDLEPLISKGVPIKHLIRLLAPLEITERKDTLRKFILEEFPAAYAKYYAKQKKAKQITEHLANEEFISEKVETSEKGEPGGIDEQPQESKHTAKKLDPSDMSRRLAKFKGKGD